MKYLKHSQILEYLEVILDVVRMIGVIMLGVVTAVVDQLSRQTKMVSQMYLSINS